MQLSKLIEDFEKYSQISSDLLNQTQVKGVSRSSIHTQMNGVEDVLEEIEECFYEESKGHYFATLSSRNNKHYLTYHFTKDVNEEIKVKFTFFNDGAFCFKAKINDGSGSFLEKISVARLLEKPFQDTNFDNSGIKYQLLLKHGLSTEISLTDFLSSVIEDFTLNYHDYATKLNLTNELLDKETEFLITSNVKKCVDSLTLFLNNYTPTIAQALFDSFETESYHIEDLTQFSKERSTEYLYTDLSNNLNSNSKVSSKAQKI